jgi:hypothetical protein
VQEKQLLAGAIAGLRPKLGDTQAGQEWCLKALHPSNPESKVTGTPDTCCFQTVMVNYNLQEVIQPVATTGTWDCTISLVPDPVSPISYQFTDTSGTVRSGILNTQISQTATTYGEVREAFLGQAERSRLTYMGVTVVADGPSLSDQGNVVAYQAPVDAELWTGGGPTLADVATVQHFYTRGGTAYQTSDAGQYGDAASFKTYYSGKSKEGVYMPLKLTPNHQEWRTAADWRMFIGHWADTARTATCPGQKQMSTVSTATKYWPHFLASTCYYDETTNQMVGDLVPRLYNHNVGHACFQGMSTATQLVVRVRMGFELTVPANSSLVSFNQRSPDADEAALYSYYWVSGRMADAFPADYNDWGKLANVIGKVAGFLKKPLAFISPTLGRVATGVEQVANWVGKNRTDKVVVAAKPVRQAPKAVIRAAPKRLVVVRRK